MTVISEHVENIAGADNQTTFAFSSVLLRESDDGTGIVTTTPIRVLPVAGVLTTPDLDPGPAKVSIGLSRPYLIEIPDSPTSIRLWPLIQAGLPIPPEEEASAIRNGGGFALGRVMTAAEYADLTAATTPDPGSVFLTY